MIQNCLRGFYESAGGTGETEPDSEGGDPCSNRPESADLAAHSLGLGACWINSLRNIYEHPAIVEYLAKLGVPKEHMAVGMVVLGYPAKEPKILERKESAIYFVDENCVF